MKELWVPGEGGLELENQLTSKGEIGHGVWVGLPAVLGLLQLNISSQQTSTVLPHWTVFSA